jgi:hypothetical protein
MIALRDLGLGDFGSDLEIASLDRPKHLRPGSSHETAAKPICYLDLW